VRRCSTLSAAAVKQLRESFLAIDKDNTGTITYAELRDAVATAGGNPEKVMELMREMDTNGDGSINYEEFLVATAEVSRGCAALCCAVLLLTRGRCMFIECRSSLLDTRTTSGGRSASTIAMGYVPRAASQRIACLSARAAVVQNGVISVEELRKILGEVSDEEATKYIGEYDLDHDGMINYEASAVAAVVVALCVVTASRCCVGAGVHAHGAAEGPQVQDFWLLLGAHGAPCFCLYWMTSYIRVLLRRRHRRAAA
jgi:Ca2+-binding EF-hand superfamily protein